MLLQRTHFLSPLMLGNRGLKRALVEGKSTTRSKMSLVNIVCLIFLYTSFPFFDHPLDSLLFSADHSLQLEQ